jgi:hypothetical protein
VLTGSVPHPGPAVASGLISGRGRRHAALCIDGLDVTTARVLMSKFGTDMRELPDDKHFASWLGLCPGTKITGGKVMSGKTLHVANRAAQALKLAAAALRSSKSALGAYDRRRCARMDKPTPVTAAAHKLARLICAMLTKGEEYTDLGQAYYEERYRQRVVAHLTRRSQQLGLQVVPIAAPALTTTSGSTTWKECLERPHRLSDPARIFPMRQTRPGSGVANPRGLHARRRDRRFPQPADE